MRPVLFSKVLNNTICFPAVDSTSILEKVKATCILHETSHSYMYFTWNQSHLHVFYMKPVSVTFILHKTSPSFMYFTWNHSQLHVVYMKPVTVASILSESSHSHSLFYMKWVTVTCILHGTSNKYMVLTWNQSQESK